MYNTQVKGTSSLPPLQFIYIIANNMESIRFYFRKGKCKHKMVSTTENNMKGIHVAYSNTYKSEARVVCQTAHQKWKSRHARVYDLSYPCINISLNPINISRRMPVLPCQIQGLRFIGLEHGILYAIYSIMYNVFFFIMKLSSERVYMIEPERKEECRRDWVG